ncbi:myosin light chain kinase 3 isoform X2 [Takifugu flavidus]|uniref:myosin light chain kinase 3 isoform X2 n=2 Tax=Takifugu flavidus TaxID=433684 RepID=UPI002544C865|nr:myosin light chain kinase 3 isoform X2 [Takifugu flavidus]XP_056893693.1 myosin light chain kinase 3 isoform X2 [Takifugu flavidus]XP_056893695.1 myosin light chain kinase 3 isoform X2 [Takifugu flavidus]
MRDMGGKEKKVLMITNVPNYQGSGKKSICNESVSAKKNGRLSLSAIPPPIPMSPIVEKMEGLKAIHNRSNSLRLGRLAFYRHLEKVETMRSFWELKHVEMERGQQQTKDDKAKLSLKGLKAQKKRKPQESSETSSLNEAALPEQVKKLNRQNTENSQENSNAGSLRQDDRGRQEPAELILDGSRTTAAQPDDRKKVTNQGEEEREEEEEDGNIFGDSESEEEKQDAKVEDDGKRKHKEKTESSNLETSLSVTADICPASHLPQQSSEEADVAACSKRRVTEEDLGKDELKKSRVDGSKVDTADGQVAEKEGEPPASKSEEVKTEVEKETEDKPEVKELILDLSPPPLAPFDHRIVTPKPHQISSYYTINRDEVLGGGRFGQVHKCMENSSGLMLAAKIIKARSQKEKEVVRNEIQVMNQLNHANLIQLYAAFESRHDFILVMEYVEGGELFDRIIDENYNLTELDTVLFIRQICEGLRYMHKMYILHLDLKPENILCINRATNKIKIIDFGLARRYKPREKLKVNFGTPEFLAPEVINYEFVSFPTDMWSLGVITYMLLSGLSPFLGDDDNETLNNILACQWNFEEEEFKDISDEAKDFITRLLVKSKSWRMSATESLRHPWLSDQSLHYQLNQKKTKCRSSHSPPPES